MRPTHSQRAFSLAPLPLPMRTSMLGTTPAAPSCASEARVKWTETMSMGRPRSTRSHGLESSGEVAAHWNPDQLMMITGSHS